MITRTVCRGLAAAVLGTSVAMTGTTAFTAAPRHCDNGYVGLTYDDGPTTGFTTTLLSTLRENGIRATLFNIGQNAQKNPSLVTGEKRAGMWIGNHSWTHPHLPQLPEDEMQSELRKTQDEIERITGRAPVLFRPPYGETNDTLKAVVKRLDLTEIIWDVDPRDWSGTPADEIVRLAGTLKDGQIMLMHDGYPATIEAIPRIAADLRSREMCAGMISPTTGRAGPPA